MTREFEAIFQAIKKNFIWDTSHEHSILMQGKRITLNDHWGLMVPDKNGILRGDCEDFCLCLSKILNNEFDIPKSDRTLTFCQSETARGHIVLSVNYKGDNYVFDNRQRHLTSLIELKNAGYGLFAQPDGPINGPWNRIEILHVPQQKDGS